MKFIKGVGWVLFWIVYLIMISVEWVLDTCEKIMVVFHSCWLELATGTKKAIDEIKNGK